MKQNTTTKTQKKPSKSEDTLTKISSSLVALNGKLDTMNNDIQSLKRDVKEVQEANKQLTLCFSNQMERQEEELERLLEHPKYDYFNKKTEKLEKRDRQYSLDLCIWIITEYRKVTKLPPLSDSEARTRARHGSYLHIPIIARFKQKKKIDPSVSWSDSSIKPYYRTLFTRLEKNVNPYIPIGGCIRFWGARIIMAKHWSSVQRSDLGAALQRNKIREGKMLFCATETPINITSVFS